jgi:putative ABC transport system permease protein
MKNLFVHLPFIGRQIIRSQRQAAVFILCVALSIVTLISLNGFSASVQNSMLKDAQTLHGADIIIRSSNEFTPAVVNLVAHLENKDQIISSRSWEFYSMVRPKDNGDSLLAKLKVVQPSYPLYGRVKLQSGREFAVALKTGDIIVARALLDRLQLRLGDRLRVGRASLKISDIVLQEPDQPVNFFFLGPRVFVSAQDLKRLDLVKKGSRVKYSYLIKVSDSAKVRAIADRLRDVADEDQERVDTYRTARSRIKRFFDNLLFFLSLISIFTLLLAGIGIQSALTAFLKEKENTIAIMKTVGATSHFFILHYVLILAVLGLAGTILGLVGGFFLQNALDVLFSGLVPRNVRLLISWEAILQGLALGVLVVGVYSFVPLYWLKEIKPVAVFRKDLARTQRKLSFYLSIFLIFFFFLALVLWQVKDLKTGAYFVTGVIVMILITALLAEIMLQLLMRLRLKSLMVRQAIKGLFRPRNATRPIIVTLTASLSVLFAIYLIERNLYATFIQSFPSDAPNLFFLDIQPDQQQRFADTLGMQTEYYPIVRANIIAVNEEKIHRQKERQRRGDNLARTFNLTYRSHLLEDEVLVKGRQLHREDWGNFQVSVLDTVAKIKEMDIGDSITFKIQGVPMKARISSIRTRTQESIQPFFYFVLPEKALRDAPQTIFTAVKASKSRIPAIQNKIAAGFPNVSAIDVTQTLSAFAGVMTKLSLIIRFFAVFSIAAGLLIILSSVLATRFARIQEAVYYKILGAKGAFVVSVFTLENLFLGWLSAMLALAISQVGSWVICVQVFDIPYRFFWKGSLLLIAGTVLLVSFVGLLPSISVLRQKPVIFLRNQTQE